MLAITVTLLAQIPPVASWNGHLSGYQLDHRDANKGGSWISRKFYNPDMERVVVDNLALFKTYEFQIKSFNMYGSSPWSPVTVVYLEMGASSVHSVPAQLLTSA